MAIYDKNGIKILGNEKVVRAAFSKVALKEEGIDNDLLQEELKAARKAARAAKVVKEAAEREAVKEANLAASKKMLSFVRGAFFNSPSEVAEVEEMGELELISPSSISEEKDGIERAIDIISTLGDNKTLAMEIFKEEHGVDIFTYHGIPELVATATKKAFEDYYLDSDESERAREIISRYIGFVARERGRKRAANAFKLSKPGLFRHYNINPFAFKYTEVEMLKKGIDPNKSWGADYVLKVTPNNIQKAWYASGCKPSYKFRYYVDEYLNHFNKNGSSRGLNLVHPWRSESLRGYAGRVKVTRIMDKYGLNFKSFNLEENSSTTLNIGDRKRLERLKNNASIYYALKKCVIATDIKKDGDYYDERGVLEECVVTEINWSKLAQWLKLPKRTRAASLTTGMAWELLFNRPCPVGLEADDTNPVYLLDKVTQRTFRQLMSVVKSESESRYALEANTRAAYNLSIIFRDLQSVKRWISKIVDNNAELTAINIHDANLPAADFIELKQKTGWLKMVNQFPELRWLTSGFVKFEKEFGRLPVGKKEFEIYYASLEYDRVEDIEVASIAAKCNVRQVIFEEYQEFFKRHTGKKATMLPKVEVSEGAYIFTKLDDFDKVGPFLGCLTDCCQHFDDAGRPCAKAGWKHSESGFYVVYKGNRIVAQSWTWRGTDGALCFDSIEGLGEANVAAISNLYARAAKLLLGKLGVSRVTVGDTSYGMTPDVKKFLDGKKCKPSKMIKDVSYSDADNQWLLAK